VVRIGDLAARISGQSTRRPHSEGVGQQDEGSPQVDTRGMAREVADDIVVVVLGTDAYTAAGAVVDWDHDGLYEEAEVLGHICANRSPARRGSRRAVFVLMLAGTDFCGSDAARGDLCLLCDGRRDGNEDCGGHGDLSLLFLCAVGVGGCFRQSSTKRRFGGRRGGGGGM